MGGVLTASAVSFLRLIPSSPDPSFPGPLVPHPLVPSSPMRWIWIDRIAELEKGARCVTVKNVSMAEEHLHDHFPASGVDGANRGEANGGGGALPVMPGSLMIEGMAQTAGILVGHARDFQEKVILAKIGRATFDRDIFPGQTLLYTATLERIDDAGASTSGTIEVIDHASAVSACPEGAPAREPVGVVELTFSHIDRNARGLKFPEHNFVFTDQFMDLLRNSGFS